MIATQTTKLPIRNRKRMKSSTFGASAVATPLRLVDIRNPTSAFLRPISKTEQKQSLMDAVVAINWIGS